MFGALKKLEVPAPVPEAPKKVSMSRGMSILAFRAAHHQAVITSRIMASLALARNTVGDFADLRRLRNVAKTQGINKALMLFANPENNVISRLAKNIPSNESLDAVSMSKNDRRTKAALEGMDESLTSETKLISDWTHSSADDIDQLLSSVEDQLKDIGQAISHYLQNLETADAEGIDLTDTVNVVTCEAAMTRLDALLEILPDMDALVSDPTDRDAMDVYKEKISQLVVKLGPVAGLSVDSENDHLVTAGPMADEHMTKQGTLAELGYTLESTIALLKKADALVDEVNGLIERKEAMVAHLHETANAITGIDNTVPPAVDGAIDEDNDDVDANAMPTGGLTQADVYHCQVSSHLYCLSVIVGVSIAAVQDVLVVAGELSENGSDNDDDDAVEGSTPKVVSE